jgi:kinetochore protein Spc7/SPC105
VILRYPDKWLNSGSQDAKMLEGFKARADELVPALDQEYENITRELEQEMAEVAEIEGSDQDYLNELKNTISEQR